MVAGLATRALLYLHFEEIGGEGALGRVRGGDDAAVGGVDIPY